MNANEIAPQYVINTSTVERLTTPVLVLRYRELYVTGSHRRLRMREVDELTTVVNELRARHVLD